MTLRKQKIRNTEKQERRPGVGFLFSALLLSCFLAFPVFALTPATLLGPDLQPQRVRVQGLLDGTLTYFDAERRLQSTALKEFLQVRFDGGATATPGAQGEAALAQPRAAALVLTDGQRLVGRWAGADKDGQIVHWDHPLVGPLQVSLDDVAAVEVSRSATGDAAGAATDRVVLANGDQLEGYVAAAGADGIVLQTTAGDRVTLPLDRVATVELSNPPRPHRADAAPEFLVWFADGTRLLSSNMQISGDEMTLVPALHKSAQPVALPLAVVRRIETVSSGDAGRLVELLNLPMTVTGGGEVFGVPMPPRRAGDALRLHAPVTVRFELPPGTARIAAEAQLDAADASRLDWADFQIVIRVDGNIVAEHTINAGTPAASINVAAQGVEATIELRQGANGPIMDRLRLSDAVVLVRRGTSP